MLNLKTSRLASILLISSVATKLDALRILSPSASQAWALGSEQTVSWETDKDDPETFSIYMTNANDKDLQNENILVAQNVPGILKSTNIAVPNYISTEGKWSLNFHKGLDSGKAYATSDDITVTNASKDAEKAETTVAEGLMTSISSRDKQGNTARTVFVHVPIYKYMTTAAASTTNEEVVATNDPGSSHIFPRNGPATNTIVKATEATSSVFKTPAVTTPPTPPHAYSSSIGGGGASGATSGNSTLNTPIYFSHEVSVSSLLGAYHPPPKSTLGKGLHMTSGPFAGLQGKSGQSATSTRSILSTETQKAVKSSASARNPQHSVMCAAYACLSFLLIAAFAA